MNCTNTLTHTHTHPDRAFYFQLLSVFFFLLFFFEEVAQIFTGKKRMLINDGNFVRVTLAKLIARPEKEVQAEVRVNCECTRYICHLVLSLLWLLLALSKSSAIKWYVKAVRRQTSHRQTDRQADRQTIDRTNQIPFWGLPTTPSTSVPHSLAFKLFSRYDRKLHLHFALLCKTRK